MGDKVGESLARLKWRLRKVAYRLNLWPLLSKLRILVRYYFSLVHDEDYYFFENFSEHGGLFADIGANSGQSALSIRIVAKSVPIVSFEANASLASDLDFVKRTLRGDFEFDMCGLGDHDGYAALFIPVVDGVPFSPEATCSDFEFERQKNRILTYLSASRIERLEVRARLKRFDDLGLCPAYVKLDVQGYELNVLLGMRECLRSCKPLLMIEGGWQTDVRALLESVGYRSFRYSRLDNTLTQLGGDSPTNVFFVHADKMSWIQAMGVSVRHRN